MPQKQYHFTNYRHAFEARLRFNPEHPTSLLYKKSGDGYQLVGVMRLHQVSGRVHEANLKPPELI